jgi:hypothetical protein
MNTTTAPTTPAATATGPASLPRPRINWRTVAFATALIYGIGIPAAAILHATGPAAPGSRIECVHGITVRATTGPDGQTTLTSPSGLPACHTSRKDNR